MTSNNTKGEHYNLRWNNFFNNLVQVFSNLKNKEQFVDVTLLCEGQQIKAHKIVLAACSDFFMDLFQNLQNTIHPIIMFYDIKYSSLKQIIQFIYQGEVKVMDVDLENVLSLGEKFQVKGLSSVKLKHKVSPTGEDICEELIKYKLVTSQSLQEIPQVKEELSTVSINVRDENTCNNDEPMIKKIKTNLVKDSSPKFKNSLNATSSSNIQSDNSHNSLENSKEEWNENDYHLNKSNDPTADSDLQFCYDLNNQSEKPSEQTMAISEKNKLNELSKDLAEKPNAFILFSKEWRKKLKVEHPEEDFKSISVRLGNLWKSLTSETRESYYVAARQAQLRSQEPKPDL